MAGAPRTRTPSRPSPRKDPAAGIRVGVDLVAVEDVATALARFGERYLERVFTPQERACALGRPTAAAASLAARFAAKEAAMKLLEPGPGGPVPGWRELEVVRLPSGACRLRFHGAAARLASAAGVAETAVSLAHEGPMACAVAVARLRSDPPAQDPPAAATRRRGAPSRALGDERKVDSREPNARDPNEGERSMDEDIRKVLAEHGRLPVDVATIGDDDDLYQIGLTSHACVKVMLALEERFDLEFPPPMLRKRTFASVGSIRDALSSLAGADA